MVRTYGEDFGVFADKIDAWDVEKWVSKLEDFDKPIKSGFQVLNHGDLWAGDIMLNSDENNCATDITFIEFPTYFWVNPMQSFIFCLYQLLMILKWSPLMSFLNFITLGCCWL